MTYVIGIDEVGRGALAGPLVVAGALILPSHPWYQLLTTIHPCPTPIPLTKQLVLKDSKKLTLKQRLRLYPILTSHLNIQLAIIPSRLIDIHGISWAFQHAINHLLGLFQTKINFSNLTLLVDGKSSLILDYSIKQLQLITHGDSKVGLIAAASVVAKVYRDNLMIRLHSRHPHYYWSTNVGYGTLQHRQAILKYGLTPYHRRSFCRRFIP